MEFSNELHVDRKFWVWLDKYLIHIHHFCFRNHRLVVVLYRHSYRFNFNTSGLSQFCIHFNLSTRTKSQQHYLCMYLRLAQGHWHYYNHWMFNFCLLVLILFYLIWVSHFTLFLSLEWLFSDLSFFPPSVYNCVFPSLCLAPLLPARSICAFEFLLCFFIPYLDLIILSSPAVLILPYLFKIIFQSSLLFMLTCLFYFSVFLPAILLPCK